MNLSRTLRLQTSHIVSFAGAGGKTSAIFQLAREVPRAVVTATTHLGVWQTSLADHHIIAAKINDSIKIPSQGVTLITGDVEGDRTKPVNQIILNWLREEINRLNIPLFIESDGSRQKSLKAPAPHEPPIPEFADTVILVAGLRALGKPLTNEHVHRAEIFSQLSGLESGQLITVDAIIRILTHPQGGLKNIPPTARRVALLNQADTPELQSIGADMAHKLIDHFDSAIVGSLSQNNFHTFEHTAGIILAAGESTRFGSPKQLLDWKGKSFIRQVAETALQAELWPVVVVTGFHAAEIESALSGLPVSVIYNSEYQQGQSTSIRAGIQALQPPPPYSGTSPSEASHLDKSEQNDIQNIQFPMMSGFGGGWAGAAVFLLADQPQIPVEVIRALVEARAGNVFHHRAARARKSPRQSRSI
jgi:molybdenum cofactor cytidylyltransferase